ncbi:S-layer homology domain-containing protein [Mastigocladopsis repens]|uniref:S-layer homology domain-containing protein n=1 Tax=Mastigocladopsis repens TaxID=221287 RepID=UPI0004745BF0|nr:S-layer homology domain-containing protein [Mastigocladopsis repens]
MTNMRPSDPKSSQTNTLGFDEFIGILVAFTTIGFILFWSFSRRDSGWNITSLVSPSPTPSASSITPVIPTTPEQQLSFIIPGVKPTVTRSPTDENTFKDELPPVSNLSPDPLQTEDPSSSQTRTTEQYSVIPPGEKLPTIPPPLAFTDVPAEFWGRRFIDVLSSRAIIKGFPDYSFRPNQPVTRAEFAAIVQQAFDKRHGGTATNFKDVAAEFWATPAINQALSTGFLKGYPDTTFKPQQKIPRVQVLVALASGLNLKVPPSPAKVLSVYKDVKDIPKYALDKVAAATENGLVVNYPDPQVFAPNQEATRAEVAAMVHQALVRMGKLPSIKSQSIVTAR